MFRHKVAKVSYIGPRVRIVRSRRGLSQQELAERMGLGDGKKIAAIESSRRMINFAELVKLAEALDAERWYFTDPFILVCEEKYRYLLSAPVGKRELDKFEEKMDEYIGNYRFLLNYFKKKDKQRTPKFDLRLPFELNSPAEFAVNAGERLATILGLGSQPIDKLQTALEEKLGIMTLMLDIDNKAVEGASLNLPEVGFICINRHLSKSARSFAIAHELFHLLTWDSLPYDRTSRATKKLKKIEEMADLFSSSLLMPRQRVVQIERINKKKVASEWVVENATDLGVSARALQVRIQQIGEQSGRDLSSVFEQLNLPKLDAKINNVEPALPFSRLYVELVSRAVDEPLFSGMAGTYSLGCETFFEAGEIFHAYGVTAPETMEFAMPIHRKRKRKCG